MGEEALKPEVNSALLSMSEDFPGLRVAILQQMELVKDPLAARGEVSRMQGRLSELVPHVAPPSAKVQHMLALDSSSQQFTSQLPHVVKDLRAGLDSLDTALGTTNNNSEALTEAGEQLRKISGGLDPNGSTAEASNLSFIAVARRALFIASFWLGDSFGAVRHWLKCWWSDPAMCRQYFPEVYELAFAPHCSQVHAWFDQQVEVHYKHELEAGKAALGLLEKAKGALAKGVTTPLAKAQEILEAKQSCAKKGVAKTVVGRLGQWTNGAKSWADGTVASKEEREAGVDTSVEEHFRSKALQKFGPELERRLTMRCREVAHQAVTDLAAVYQEAQEAATQAVEKKPVRRESVWPGSDSEEEGDGKQSAARRSSNATPSTSSRGAFTGRDILATAAPGRRADKHVLSVLLVEGRDLAVGKGGTFCRLKLVGQEQLSRVEGGGGAPIWAQAFEFELTVLGAGAPGLHFECREKMGDSHKLIGFATLQLTSLRPGGSEDCWLDLSGRKGGKLHVQVSLD